MSAINGHLLLYHVFVFIMLTQLLYFGSALSPLSVNLILFTVTGVISLPLLSTFTLVTGATSGATFEAIDYKNRGTISNRNATSKQWTPPPRSFNQFDT